MNMAQWAGEGPRLILILGGARSGKSSFAERLALRSGRSVAYIATATAGDADMEERIKRHRAGRPASWLTVEEPLNLARALREAAAGADVLLLDCLTLWLSNWLLRRGDIDDAELADGGEGYSEEVLAVIDDLLIEFARLAPRKVLVVVSNEVGLGIVPAYALGRLYRDILGRVNQRLAAAASQVYLMVAGLGVDIKRLHEEAGL